MYQHTCHIVAIWYIFNTRRFFFVGLDILVSSFARIASCDTNIDFALVLSFGVLHTKSFQLDFRFLGLSESTD